MAEGVGKYVPNNFFPTLFNNINCSYKLLKKKNFLITKFPHYQRLNVTSIIAIEELVLTVNWQRCIMGLKKPVSNK